MPAITLGLAEAEERLQALRWRLNFRTAQHGIYVAVATAALLSTVLIPIGLHASPATFRVVVYASAFVLLVVVLTCGAYAWRRWSDIRGVARLVDQRAQLTDRLTTLIDLRLRQRTSRLAPVLVAQTLALGDRWHAQRIVPRRVPRSVFLVIFALLALAGTALVEHRTRPRRDPVAAPPTHPAARDTVAAAPQSASDQLARAPASGEPAGTQGGTSTGSAGAFPGSGSESPLAAASRSDTSSASGKAHVGPASLTDRLQQAIADTFRADKPEAREPRRGQGDGASNADARAPATDDLQRSKDTDTRHPSTEHARSAGSGKTGTASTSGPNALQRPGGANAQRKFTGDSPGAGEGSSPDGLMRGAAPPLGDDAPASKPFTLTITSVPRAREMRGTAADRTSKATGVPGLAPAAANIPPAVSERQLEDDALRKAEIPPEYEDVIRGVFTSRAGR